MENIDKSKLSHQLHEASMQYWAGAFDVEFDDTRRHFSMLQTALPIAQALSPKTILTIGDNRGRDAYFFKKNIGCFSIASDLDISKLLPAKNDGFIDDCRIIDVEKIDYPDNSIDLIVIKESFHHWPRPMLGFYEALRVARLGVLLIEPNDALIGSPSLQPYVNVDSYSNSYEEVGNFLYRISLREILKSAWSLYLNTVIAKGFNDPYRDGYTFSEWEQERCGLDIQGENGSREFNLMTIFVEKKLDVIDLSLLNGYKIYSRPKNPYLPNDL